MAVIQTILCAFFSFVVSFMIHFSILTIKEIEGDIWNALISETLHVRGEGTTKPKI